MADEKDFSKLSDIIQNFRVQYNKEQIDNEGDFFSEWKSVVGEKLAQHSAPKKLTQDGILIISCTNSVVANEIFNAKDKINKKLKTIANNSGINCFKYIKITYGQ